MLGVEGQNEPVTTDAPADDAGENGAGEEAKVPDEREQLQAAIAAVEAKLPAARGKLNAAQEKMKDSGENGYMLLAADFQRFREWSEGELGVQKDNGRANTLRGLLPFVEAFEQLQSGENGDEGAAIDGIYAGVYKQTQALLTEWKVAPFEAAAGEKYDVARHARLEFVASEDVPDGVILEARQRGWTVGDKTLRAAAVVVSSGPPAPPPAAEAGADAAPEASEETDADAAPEASGETDAAPGASGETDAGSADEASRAGEARMAVLAVLGSRRDPRGGQRRAPPASASEAADAEEAPTPKQEEAVDEATSDENATVDGNTEEAKSDIDQKEAKKDAKSDAANDLLNTTSFLKAKLKVLEKELAEVEEQTAAVEAEAEGVAADWTDKRTRLQTDFDNFKARQAGQVLEAQLDIRIQVLSKFLAVLDNFDRARATSSPAGEAEQARNDLYDQLHADLMTALGGLGLEQFESLGKEFDVNLHMAVQQMPSEDYESGTVCSELQPGYNCEGKLVRAAYVAVAI